MTPINKSQVKAAAPLIESFLYTLLFEYGSIVAWGYAARRRKQQPRQPVALADPADTEQTSFPGPVELPEPAQVAPRNSGNSGNPGNGGGNRVYSRIEAESDLLTRLAMGETVASQDDLAARWGVNKGTVSKWLRSLEDRDLIPVRQQIGRCKQLTKA